MTLIMTMLRRLKEVYPDKMVSIEHDHVIYSEGTEAVSYNLYIGGTISKEYPDFISLVNAVNKLTGTMTHIVIVHKGGPDADPYANREPRFSNDWGRAEG